MEALFTHPNETYGVVYFAVVLVLCLLEWIAPHQPVGEALRLRWFGNIAIMSLGHLLVRSVVPLTAMAWAAHCASRGWGLLNHFAVPPAIALPATVIALDLTSYVKHYLSHRIPALWLVHRTHHTDLDCDFSTGLRFHPLDVVCDTLSTLAAATVLGASPVAVAVAQTLSMAVNFIEHANLHVPTRIEHLARLVVVTPDMHRVHHSRDGRDSQSNFGVLFPWWDRLLRTHRAESALGSSPVPYGVAGFLDRRHATLPYMLAQPFFREDGSAVRPRSGWPWRAL